MKTKPQRFKPEQIKAALQESGGIFAGAAQLLNCAPNTIRNHVRRSKKLQEALVEIQDFTLDLAETQLLKSIKDGDLRAIMFYLKTKGRGRGFVERTELTAPGKKMGGSGGLHVYLPAQDDG